MSVAGIIAKPEMCKCDRCGKIFARMAMKPEDKMLLEIIFKDKQVVCVCDECKKKVRKP